MAANLLEALLGIHVDLSGLESGLKQAESLTEQSTKKISSSFSLMSAGIAAAIAGTVIVALEKAIKTTAEYGLEMEHLGDRLGMTAQQAAVLTGVLERQGLGTQVAARAFQIMAMQAKQTTEALDPFSTRLGRVLGSLRDAQGQTMNTAQIFDLARQKIQGVTGETEKLQIAQQIFGARMGGQLLPVLKMSNDEWEKQKASVAGALGPMDAAAKSALAYKQASAELEQTFKGLQIALGNELLPTLTNFIERISDTIKGLKEFGEAHPIISSLINPIKLVSQAWESINAVVAQTTFGVLKVAEAVHLVEKGTADAFKNMEKNREAGRAAAAAQREAADAAAAEGDAFGITEKVEEKLVKLSQDRIKYAEELRKMGGGSQAEIEEAASKRLSQLTEERLMLEKQLTDVGLTQAQQEDVQVKLMKNRVESAQTLAKVAADSYQEEELHAKAQGLVNSTTELQFLQTQLADARIVGDERLKLEAQLYEKRKAYEEESVKLAISLGAMSVDQEIAYRKSHAAELLGKGDVVGAGNEIVKARDLAMQQADQQMEFVKKLHTVSLQSEIDFQAQKLQVVKGNAQEEMKVISTIADLDKKLYNDRLQFGLTYTQSIIDQYNKVEAAAKKSGEVQTFEQAKVDSERKLIETTREARGVLSGGGTDQQREAAVGFAQYVNKQVEQMQSLGKEVSGIWKDAADTAKDILKAASGGEEVRAPGGPSPTVGSILGPIEGLATQGLARGSDIPRLDTSFTDLATRLRDVLNTNVSNLINFGTVVGDVAKKVAAVTGVGFNPGAVGPGGSIIAAGSTGTLPNTGGGTATVSAPPATTAPGNTAVTPTPQTGITTPGNAGNDQIVSAIKDLSASIDKQTEALTTAQQNSADQINEAISQIQSSQKQVQVTVGVDQGSGILTTTTLERELAP